MNWLFWVLLIIALLFLFAPLGIALTAAFRAVLWIIGALLLIAAIIWAVGVLSRSTQTGAPPA